MGRPSVVEELKDLGELAGIDQTGEDPAHFADAGVTDDEPIRAPEVAACEGFPAGGPSAHEDLDLRKGDGGRAPPGAVLEIHEDIDVVDGLHVLAGIRQERGLELL